MADKRFHLGFGLLLALMVWLMPDPGACLAQTPVPASSSVQPPPDLSLARPWDRFDLDMAIWMQSSLVLPTAPVEDAVWQVPSVPGRQLVMVPLLVGPSDQPVVLDASSSLRLVGGRLVAWLLEVDPSSISPVMEPQEWERWKSSWPATGQLPAVAGVAAGGDVPRMMRKLVRLPDGRWSWELERAIAGASLKEQADQLYVYKIKPDLLDRKLPAKPKIDPPPAGESREAKAARLQKLQQEVDQYRQQEKAIGQMKLLAIRLPERFVAPAWGRAWAVLEVRSGFSDWTLEGPSPLPWKINLSAWQTLRGLKPGDGSGNGRSSGGIFGWTGGAGDSQVMVQLQAIRELTQSPNHPLNHRMAAQALADSGLLVKASKGDMAYQSALAIFDGPDSPAKQLLVRKLFQPPAGELEVAIALAESALQSDDPLLLMALVESLGAKSASTQESSRLSDRDVKLAMLLRASQRLMAWPSEPPLLELMQQLVQVSQDHPLWLAKLAGDLPLLTRSMPPKRQAGVIGQVIHLAQLQAPLAERWLDEQLLNGQSATAAQIRLTLTELAQAAQERSPQGLIRLDSVRHGLLTCLSSSDASTAALAWRALACFTLAGENPSGRATASSAAANGEILSAIMQSAWKQKSLPSSLGTFLSHLPDSPWTTAALMQVAAYGPQDSSSAAAKLLLTGSASGSSRRLDGAILLIGPPERYALAARLYGWQHQPVPTAAFLLLDRHPRSPVAIWFAGQLMAGRLPEASAWLAGGGGQANLLPYLWSSDANLALGAASALAASVDGSDEQAKTFLADLRQSNNQSPEYAQAQWHRFRHSLLMQRLAKADGYYRLIIRLWASDPRESLAGGSALSGAGEMAPHPSAKAAQGPLMQQSLGVIRLFADGQSVRLANQAINVSVPSDMLALRIEKPVDLKNLNNAQVARLPLEKLSGPIDLLPVEQVGGGGGWLGQVVLTDGQRLELFLQPMRDAVASPSPKP